MTTAWAHNTERGGDGTVPVIVHSTIESLANVQGSPDEWHPATDEEYAAFESYWAKEFPHMPMFIIKEGPV